MGITREPAILVLSIWLILTGLLALVDIDFPGRAALLALLAIFAGVLLLLRRVTLGGRLGVLLLAIYLILLGLIGLLGLSFSGSEIVLALLALAAGILLLIGR